MDRQGSLAGNLKRRKTVLAGRKELGDGQVSEWVRTANQATENWVAAKKPSSGDIDPINDVGLRARDVMIRAFRELRAGGGR